MSHLQVIVLDMLNSDIRVSVK